MAAVTLSWIFMDQLLACERNFPSSPGVGGVGAVVTLCGSSWISCWLVKGIFKFTGVGGGADSLMGGFGTGVVVILCGSVVGL